MIAPALRAALIDLLDRYVDLVNCGDCGFWNAEEEPVVIAARAALAPVRPLPTEGSPSPHRFKETRTAEPL